MWGYHQFLLIRVTLWAYSNNDIIKTGYLCPLHIFVFDKLKNVIVFT